MQTAEALRNYYGRVVPAIPELFNMAYAICGNYDLAEYALQYTLLQSWLSELHGGMGFRENLRNTVKRVAMEEALEPRAEALELTWDGLCEESDDPVLRLLAQEDAELRRMVALRYGCGLSAARIGKLMGTSAGRTRELLDRFERRTLRRLPKEQKRRGEAAIARAVANRLSQPDSAMPSLSAIYRSFESEATEIRRPSHLASRILHRVLCIVLIALCGVVFWLAAVLMQPAPLDAPASVGTIQEE